MIINNNNPFKSREVSEDFTFAVAGLYLHSNFRPRFLNFPIFKLLTIVNSFISWTYI